jgi:hypothetical protein
MYLAESVTRVMGNCAFCCGIALASVWVCDVAGKKWLNSCSWMVRLEGLIAVLVTVCMLWVVMLCQWVRGA